MPMESNSIRNCHPFYLFYGTLKGSKRVITPFFYRIVFTSRFLCSYLYLFFDEIGHCVIRSHTFIYRKPKICYLLFSIRESDHNNSGGLMLWSCITFGEHISVSVNSVTDVKYMDGILVSCVHSFKEEIGLDFILMYYKKLLVKVHLSTIVGFREKEILISWIIQQDNYL